MTAKAHTMMQDIPPAFAKFKTWRRTGGLWLSDRQIARIEQYQPSFLVIEGYRISNQSHLPAALRRALVETTSFASFICTKTTTYGDRFSVWGIHYGRQF